MSNVRRLTKRAIDCAVPRDKPFILYDSELAGFGLRIMPSGFRSWIVEYRPNGGGRGVAKKRMTLGAVGKLTPDQARSHAKTILANVALGRTDITKSQINGMFRRAGVS